MAWVLPQVATGVSIALSWTWLSEPFAPNATATPEVAARGLLERLVLITGAAATLGGIFRLIGHFEVTTGKPLDLAGKSFGLAAALYATAYASFILFALGR